MLCTRVSSDATRSKAVSQSTGTMSLSPRPLSPRPMLPVAVELRSNHARRTCGLSIRSGEFTQSGKAPIISGSAPLAGSGRAAIRRPSETSASKAPQWHRLIFVVTVMRDLFSREFGLQGEAVFLGEAKVADCIKTLLQDRWVRRLQRLA